MTAVSFSHCHWSSAGSSHADRRPAQTQVRLWGCFHPPTATAILRVNLKPQSTNALFPLVVPRARCSVNQWKIEQRFLVMMTQSCLLSANEPCLVTQKLFIICWYQFLWDKLKKCIKSFLSASQKVFSQVGSKFAICADVLAITNVKQPSSQWVVPLFLPTHCEKGSKYGFCHSRLIKDTVALHDVNYLYSVESSLLCFCFIQL